MRIGIVAIMAVMAAFLPPSGAARLREWNSEGFFATADAADVCACLRAGADPGARGRDGHTPLHIVALGGNAAAIAALLEAGADCEDAEDGREVPFRLFAVSRHLSATPLEHV